MCISTAYRNAALPENILLKNVRAFRISGNSIILTNILEQELTIAGMLVSADLINGIVIIACEV
ncbi:MAG: CooT family nickel-binding protein [Christensenella sp.]|nr:CooT family nickel-binding protein [Christensenella sp.]